MYNRFAKMRHQYLREHRNGIYTGMFLDGKLEDHLKEIGAMNSFIEEFYYGNIDPQARSSEQNKKVQHDMQTLNESEDFLTGKLSGEEKKRFLQYVDAWAAVNGESTLDSFITGFRLGAQFTFNTFVTSKAPYADYLKDEI